MAGWGCSDFGERFSQRTQARCRHRAGRGDTARARCRVHVVEPARGRVRRRRDHAVRPRRLCRPLRVRGEGLRPDGLDRPQAGAADGPLHAPDPRRGAAGGRRLGARDRAGGGPDRRLGCDRDRRTAVVPGMPLRARRARPGSGQSVLDPGDHPQPRRRLGLDRARDARPVALGVHGVCCLEHGDRRRSGRDPAGSRRRDALRRHRSGGV